MGAYSGATGLAFGKTIHAEHADVDGLVYASRLTGEDVYAIYGRSVRKLKKGRLWATGCARGATGCSGAPRDRTPGLAHCGGYGARRPLLQADAKLSRGELQPTALTPHSTPQNVFVSKRFGKVHATLHSCPGFL